MHTTQTKYTSSIRTVKEQLERQSKGREEKNKLNGLSIHK